MRITIAGSSGLIGTALIQRLVGQGHHVTRLVRGTATNHTNESTDVRWDPAGGVLPHEAIEGVDAVVNLAGAGVGDHRWTPDYKRELVDSRIRTTALLASSIAAASAPPTVLLSGSAIGWYGDRHDEVLDESSPRGTGFFPDLCQQWEDATAPASDAGCRVAHLRTGIVLSAAGGALKKQLPLFKLGLGGKFGSGRNWQSWIAIDDEIAAIEHLLTADVAGAVNLTAPEPVTNATFTKVLGAVLHRPTIVPIPSFGPKLLLGAELADAVLFSGQRVMPTRLVDSGFQFAHPQL
ncbi:MAG: Epimerase, partial [Ilumatobacteraceae bacterium]|nr:Epimerase [Ilumatobacteraceae bacterium]